MTAVIDANVLIKAYIPEILSERAEKILEQVDKGRLLLVVPDLIFPEIGNILWKKYRLKELTDVEVREISKEIVSLPLKIEPAKPLMELALEMALAYGITVYDSLYFSLAVVYDIRLITADENLVNKLKNSEFNRHVRWLGDFSKVRDKISDT